MRRLMVTTFMTLDGVMQAPGGPGEDDSGDFTFGGWSVNYWDERMREFMTQTMSVPFDLLLGRRTYDIFVTYWPDAPEEAGSKPLNDLEDWNQEMFDRSGYGVDRITFSPSAWRLFVNHAQTKDMLDNTVRGSENALETGPGQAAPFQFRGRLKSMNVDLYVYNDKYEDNNGVAQPFLADGDIVLTSYAVDGVRAFGAILDDDANYQSLPMFPKMFKVPDPSGVFIMTQSAPLMIPKRPDATMKITVK